MNVTDPIRRFARAQPDLPALIRADSTTISYRALDRLIDRFAQRVVTLGLQPGQTVALALAGPDEALALILALALARIGIASAELSLPAQHLAAAFLQPGTGAPGGVRAIPLDASWLAESDAAAASKSSEFQDGDAILRVFATSGTTGTARHCPISHATMVTRVTAARYAMLHDEERLIMICALGLGGTSAQRAVLTALGAGGTIVFTNPVDLANAVLRHRVNFITTSPNTLQALVARIPPGIGPLPSLRAVHVTGSQLPARLARAAADRLCATVITLFGTTEVGAAAFGRANAPNQLPFAVRTIGADVQVQAVDADHNPLPPGAEGVLRIRTPGIATHYLDDAAATAASFRDGWFYSGDLGAVTTDGMLIVTGRTGDFINSGGVKISPHVIEEVLLSLPQVSQAAAFGVPDADGLAQIWAAIVAEPPVEKAILDHLCAERLGARAPSFVLQLKDLPRNANGKVLIGMLVEFAAQHYKRPSGRR